MAIQGKQATAGLVGPDLNLVIIAPRDKQRLSLVKINTANRAIVFFEPVDQGSHAVVPQLDRRGMEGNKNPWSAKGVLVLAHFLLFLQRKMKKKKGGKRREVLRRGAEI